VAAITPEYGVDARHGSCFYTRGLDVTTGDFRHQTTRMQFTPQIPCRNRFTAPGVCNYRILSLWMSNCWAFRNNGRIVADCGGPPRVDGRRLAGAGVSCPQGSAKPRVSGGPVLSALATPHLPCLNSWVKGEHPIPMVRLTARTSRVV